jgi:hypothetical protein
MFQIFCIAIYKFKTKRILALFGSTVRSLTVTVRLIKFGFAKILPIEHSKCRLGFSHFKFLSTKFLRVLSRALFFPHSINSVACDGTRYIPYNPPPPPPIQTRIETDNRWAAASHTGSNSPTAIRGQEGEAPSTITTSYYCVVWFSYSKVYTEETSTHTHIQRIREVLVDWTCKNIHGCLHFVLNSIKFNSVIESFNLKEGLVIVAWDKSPCSLKDQTKTLGLCS